MKWYWKVLLWIGGVLGGLIVLIGVLIGCFAYNMYWKRTTCGEAVSPDGAYTLSLIAIGEPAWPFGPAKGELVLKKGKENVAESGFVLYDDGGCIRESCWEVLWKEDGVQVVIRGDEQCPEEFILGFDGETESRQITD